MEEAIGSAGSGQLLALIGLTLVGAVFFAAVIYYSSIRSRRKNTMKLGIQPGSTHATAGSDTQGPASPSQNDLDISVLSRRETDPPLIIPHEEPGSPQNLFGTQTGDMEDADMQRSYDNKEKIDLAARLGSSSNPNPGHQPEGEELLRLLRHPDTGQLVVEVAGRRYNRLTDVTDKKVGQYVLKLAAHLLAFTNGMIATDAGVKSVYHPKVEETPHPLPASPDPAPVIASERAVEASGVYSSGVAPAMTNARHSLLTSNQGPAAVVEEEKPQRRGIFGLSRPATSEPRLPMLNLAGQINDIVQARLLNSPLAGSYRVEIRDDPGGGIRIYVNDVFYNSPDDMPDDRIKELIKGAVKEWERS